VKFADESVNLLSLILFSDQLLDISSDVPHACHDSEWNHRQH